jgi:glycosyltransferase involved in cell wall biosynthesis
MSFPLATDCLHPTATDLQRSSAPALRVRSYWLRPLLSIRQDDLRKLLGPYPGVYICNCPEQAWFEHFGIPGQDYRATVEKKACMFSHLASGSRWISPTSPVRWGDSIRTWQSPRMLHLGAGPLCGRAAQVVHTLQLFCWLTSERASYRYVLMYNFYLPIFLVGVYAKYVLGKSLFVEYQDDYTKRRTNRLKNLFEHMLRKICCGAICVNEHMVSAFADKPVAVCNGFADLSYTGNCDFSIREGMTFLFGGSLDEIRGIDLVPELVSALQSKISAFRILVTGSGPLRSLVESWSIPEVTYCGLLDEKAYSHVISKADACLILQKPDHPFSRGSFPSKVEQYAKHKKPIFVLSLV